MSYPLIGGGLRERTSGVDGSQAVWSNWVGDPTFKMVHSQGADQAEGKITDINHKVARLIR